MPDETVNVTMGGITVSATAHLDRMVWNMGDGHTVRCEGANATGTPYNDSYGNTMSKTCGYRYVKQGRYTLSAQAQWTVTWGGAATGTDQLSSTTTAPVLIGEYQVLTQ